MLKSFEVIASQVVDHGLRIDEAVKKTSSLRKLIEENNTILKGVDARLKEVGKVQLEWRERCDKEAEESEEEENKKENDED